MLRYPSFLDHRKVNVEIPILPLRRGDVLDHGIGQGLQIGVGVKGQAIAHRLKPLGHVRVPKNVGRVGVTRFPVQFPGIDTPCILALLISHRDGDLAVGRLPRRPEPVIDLDLGERDRFHLFSLSL
jgi:hypothetical protein